MSASPFRRNFSYLANLIKLFIKIAPGDSQFCPFSY